MPHPGSRAVLLIPILAVLALLLAARGSTVQGGVSPQCVITVNSTADNASIDDFVTLREAIGFATGLYDSPTPGEAGQIDDCPGDDDAPGADRSDLIVFDEAVFPGTGTTISLNSNLPPLDAPGDTIDGTGANVTVSGVDIDDEITCFQMNSNFNTIIGLIIRDCEVGVLIGEPLAVLLGEDVQPQGGPPAILGNLLAGNVISANITGVWVSFPGVTNNVVAGNLIGTNPEGDSADGNEVGVFVLAAGGNTVGRGTPVLFSEDVGAEGDLLDAGNVISGNEEAGVWILDGDGTEVMGNIIGLAANGVDPIPNGVGVHVEDSAGIRIGSSDPDDRNIISSNDFGGISIEESPTTLSGGLRAEGLEFTFGTSVQGNYIGTDISGALGRGNGSEGIEIDEAIFNMIGGDDEGEGNVISDNAAPGIRLDGSGAFSNVIQGNFIGTDATGTSALGNSDGIRVQDAPGNLIGGLFPDAANVISGNNVAGVFLNGPGTEDNEITGNFIGTAANGTTPLGNLSHGVEVANTGPNLIGGPDADDGNTIAFNGGDGVMIEASVMFSTNKRIWSNSIHSNDGLGIDLENDGVTLNDAGDPDVGANEHQNYPVLTSANSEGGVLTVTGTLNSSANDGFTIQFFANNECDPTDFGEGQTFLGQDIVNSDGAGNATIDEDLPPVTPGMFVTATATDPDGNTSEFSRCIEVTGPLVYEWGDFNCHGSVDELDGLDMLIDLAGLPAVFPNCPGAGDIVSINGTPRTWGDWNCSGDYDEADAIALLMYLAGLEVDAPGACPDIGQEVEVEEVPI